MCSLWADGLGATRQQAEQAVRRKPVSIISPWPLPQFLPPDSCPTSLDDGLQVVR